jgi:hypothetical protein
MQGATSDKPLVTGGNCVVVPLGSPSGAFGVSIIT